MVINVKHAVDHKGQPHYILPFQHIADGEAYQRCGDRPFHKQIGVRHLHDMYHNNGRRNNRTGKRNRGNRIILAGYMETALDAPVKKEEHIITYGSLHEKRREYPIPQRGGGQSKEKRAKTQQKHHSKFFFALERPNHKDQRDKGKNLTDYPCGGLGLGRQ
jgi:hypothetical protein